ncbi:hypothetical protein [Roseococcus suduntuyensis]|uniref:Uncharacterized protein n=1 Tax=Roseococcus suduntuyensis TaxID=455361 RepID=A0A840A6M8_9PROT|nr:hypothetical protein [Roseococcus suduntuyensis]MBB3897678.1 hypothetical protein [Roseococcus suduntuyensis]
MILAELQNQEILAQLPVVDGINPVNAIELAEYLCIDGFVAIPVFDISSAISKEVDPEIVDESGTVLGVLCITGKLSDLEPTSLTKWQYISYLTDIEAHQAGNPTVFKKNYFVVESIFLQKYTEKYMNFSHIWGGFSHTEIQARPSRVHEQLKARQDILIPTRHHEATFRRYLTASNGFDRFLRLYHSLELMFDFAFFKNLQKLNDDLDGLNELSRAYGKNEFDKLKQILNEFCHNREEIAQYFWPISSFQTKAEEVFQDHTREGNPLKDRWQKFINFCALQQTSEADLIQTKFIGTADEYNKLISNIAAYWIYRVRCSIAHNRIGEFVFEDSDEDFILEFMEPMILVVCTQVFTSPKLRILVST